MDKNNILQHKLKNMAENTAASSGPEFGFPGNGGALNTVVTSPITGDSSRSAWEADHLWKRRAEVDAGINNSPVVGAGEGGGGCSLGLFNDKDKQTLVYIVRLDVPSGVRTAGFILFYCPQVGEGGGATTTASGSVNASQQKSLSEIYTPTVQIQVYIRSYIKLSFS